VTAQLTDARIPGSLNVHFEIEEGPRTRIRKIDFAGNTVFTDRRLRRAMKLTREKGLFTRFSGKDIYHPVKFDQDMREIESLYHNMGYIELLLSPPEVKVVEEKESDKPGKSRKWVHVIQHVDEGRQYRVGQIGVSGNTVFSDEHVRGRIPLREGQILNNALLQAGLDLVEADYGQRGYLYISTNRVIDRRPDGIADITVRVSEDKPYKIDRIEFAGNTVTRDSVLRREMQVDEGDLLDIQKLRLGLRRVNQLGFFQIQKEPVIEPVEGTDGVHVTVEGVEQRRSELQVGGGYSGLDGGFFTANYQTRNFLGRGNLVTFNAQVGSIATRYVISFTEPYFLGRPIILGFSLFRRTTDYTDFDTDSGGGTLTLGYRFKVFHSLSAAYLFEEVNFDPITGIGTETRTSSFRPLYSYNTINNYFRPSRGFQFLASVELAGGVLGGDNYFAKSILRTTKYIKAWGRTHWALHAEAGYVGAFGGRLLPTFERFFLGGERSLRIFETRSIAPDGYISRFYPDLVVFDVGECPEAPAGRRHARQARCDRFVAGGNKMLLFNLEYVFPTQGPVDLALFLDAGNVFIEDDRITLPDLRKDAGVEVRFFLPVFGAPLRLIYGFNLDPEEGEDKSNFVFSVGTTF
jgi:outer membrane protein insertion porin family